MRYSVKFPKEKLLSTLVCVCHSKLFFCRFPPTSFASIIDPIGLYDTPLSWDLEGNGQSASKLICDTMMIQQVDKLVQTYNAGHIFIGATK